MTTNALWVEAYRPKTIDGYVFRDEHQRNQIQQWITEQSIPHLLLSGSPGIGKCLAGTELIDVEIDPSTLTAEQLQALEQYRI